MMNAHIIGILRTKPGTKPEHAIRAIEIAVQSGLETVEITSNSHGWENVVSTLAEKNINIGVGSIKDAFLAREAIDVGAKFLVCPGLFKDAIDVAKKFNIPILPGIYTELEAIKVRDLGIKQQKFFPANIQTDEELFKAIREPFRDEFCELEKSGWKIIPYTDEVYEKESIIIDSPTEFYSVYLSLRNKTPKAHIVIKLPFGNVGFERLYDIAKLSNLWGIKTYAVGGINSTNMKEVFDTYKAYGVCPGSSIFNPEAIYKGDFNKVKSDIKKHMNIFNEVLALV